jgi:hypothetical protein
MSLLSYVKAYMYSDVCIVIYLLSDVGAGTLLFMNSCNSNTIHLVVTQFLLLEGAKVLLHRVLLTFSSMPQP